MANWTQAERAIKEGKTAQRNIWPACKTIRAYNDSDADHFNNEFNSEGAIICECPKPCDCDTGIWIPDTGDKEATDWHFSDKK